MRMLAMPARKIPLSYRNITGHVHSNKSDEYTHFESGLERKALLLCEFDDQIEKFKTQPRRFEFIHDGKKRHYTPDILIKFKDGRLLYIEVKYRSDLKKDWEKLKPKFKAAIRELKSEPNTRFRIWTEQEILSPFLQNVTFLLPYKNRPFEKYQLATIQKILSRGQPTPINELLALCSTDEMEQAEFLNTLWYAVANQLVTTDLSTPLNMNQLIWVKPEYSKDENNE
ncbi:TnsA endonuclease N-terminal domain-containing protein [Thiomicrospira sp. S5]|uniref:TnsA endonuclease N-terminal domain-containing protein n=1 Tax=Thiomicrospira sp. S5 TaxID=1803865 RepID=UPI000F89EF4C|nr:TnsA endonuclease N-terminal domain-containing protein [Thiomicrospira sp. S5]AZR82957.1 hypothetical protein AYJ59_12150 [Thiomicrospira sp. S5]